MEEVARRLNLRQAVIEQLEDDDYDSKAHTIYTKGYLRAYARLLELDEADVLARFDAQGVGGISESQMQSFSKKTVLKEKDSRLMKVSWLLLLALLAMLVWWGWQQVGVEAPLVPEPLEEEVQGRAQAEVGTSIDIPISRSEPVQAEAPATQPQSQVAAEASQVTESTQQMPQEIEPEPQPSAASAEPQTEISALALSFSGDCWVKIVDASGKVLTIGVKKAGDQLNLAGQAPFSLTLGAPEVVSLSHAGQGVDLSAFKPGKVARLKVPN
ncbi:RodZ domain-containing protein [Gallaecimonas sp. GXIMD4217]|uniref:RodZ domain-containing protein n=1 Tax=Gallaecimonas sp. GXIMD4217 TaxID=3131927 RepID=UPI00311B2DF3